MSVVVLGAGIVGLTTAAHIQDLLPSMQVTVIADKFNAETTSDGAAGLFYPSQKFKGPTETSAMEWVQYSYKYYESLLKENCGVFEVSGYKLSSTSNEDFHNKLMLETVPQFRPATLEEMSRVPGVWKYGLFVQTLIIRCRDFLPWLLKKIKSKGGKTVKRTVKDFSELAGHYDVIVNCSGLEARTLCNDETVLPIRGQIIKVYDPSVTQYLSFDNTYIIPYGEGIVSLGGIYEHNNWNTEVSHQDSASIRGKCSAVVASLADAPTSWEWAGLRPYRETVRLETETKNSLKLVHNYGHGGSGITMAPGSAKDAALLVQGLLQAHSSLN